MDETRKSGRVTIPTDLDVVPETLEILKKWGADAIRDCDGTDFPQQLKDADAKIYSTSVSYTHLRMMATRSCERNCLPICVTRQS